MIVRGVTITNGWWIGGGSDTNNKAAPMGSVRSPSLPSVNVGPSPGPLNTIEMEWQPPEPVPFIFIGRPEVMIATSILSNPTVQKWVSNLWGGEPDAGLAL